MKLYKLTNTYGYTTNRTKWGVNVTHHAIGSPRQDLCSNGWIHAYTDPLLAVFFNPIGAAFNKPRLWEAKGKIGKRKVYKVGCRTLTTVRELRLPKVTRKQRIAFALLVAMKVCKNRAFYVWAKQWLSGRDRTHSSAWTTYCLYRGTRRISFAILGAVAALAYCHDYAVSYATARAAAYAASAGRHLNLARIARKALQY